MTLTQERAKELLPIIQAVAEGKTIQWQTIGGAIWTDLLPEWEPRDGYKYRIKPEPRRVELWEDLGGRLLQTANGDYWEATGHFPSLRKVTFVEVLE